MTIVECKGVPFEENGHNCERKTKHRNDAGNLGVDVEYFAERCLHHCIVDLLKIKLIIKLQGYFDGVILLAK